MKHRFGALQGHWSTRDLSRVCEVCGVEVRLDNTRQGEIRLLYFRAGKPTENKSCITKQKQG